MSIDHVEEFMTDIYRTKFFRLFFHWSYQVRNIFYYLILYIIGYRIKFMSYKNFDMSKYDITNADTVSNNIKIAKNFFNERFKRKIGNH